MYNMHEKRRYKSNEKTFKSKQNISVEENNSLKNLAARSDIIIKKADKGGKIVVMDKNIYIQNCLNQLSDTIFYKKLD